ncbi:MAG: hypothetical protein WA324_28665 [Bryobacteraceae bacterium]
MKREETNPGETLRLCRSRQAETMVDARAIGLGDEFEAGLYSQMQINQWAGEQWLAWLEAMAQDRRAAEGIEELEAVMVPVRVRRMPG